MSEGKNLIGVDIGADSIKVCEITEDRKGTRMLTRFGFHPLPPESIVDGHVMNSSAIVEGLEKIFHKVKRRDVAMRVTGHGVIIKKITLPVMTDAELAEQINWEAEQHIPFDLAEVQLDYQVLERFIDRGQMEVLLVAAKRESVVDLTNVATEARLRPKVVDLDAFAVQNCFETAFGAPGIGETVVLLDIGASVTTLNILSNGTTSFTRDITNGGQYVTEEIQKTLGLERAQAEAFKCEVGQSGARVPPEVERIVTQSMEELAGEVQRSLDFFLATSNQPAVHKIYSAGGSSNSTPLIRAIERRSHVAVIPIDPLRVAAPDPRTVDLSLLQGRTAQAVVACGLALRKERERRV